MGETATVTAKKPRARRRNFAEERFRVVMFCKMSIAAGETLIAGLDDAPNVKLCLGARIGAYRDVLKQMGESEA